MSLKLVLLYKKRKTYYHGINSEFKSNETTLPPTPTGKIKNYLERISLCTPLPHPKHRYCKGSSLHSKEE